MATVLGLDIGGANLKAATPEGKAISVPFALWKHPEQLPTALASLIQQFPDVQEFAVTMTGELCDCFETKRDGVNSIISAMMSVSGIHPVRIWSTSGQFLSADQARQDWLGVAAANWHALATFVGSFNPQGTTLLLDIGSTTTDIIPILNGIPWTVGKTDPQRLREAELIYTGAKRTPLCALLPAENHCAEFFATTQDVYLALELVAENPTDTDTADNRPVTRKHAHARLSRMLGGDPELISTAETVVLAKQVHQRQLELIRFGVQKALSRIDQMSPASPKTRRQAVVSGSGEFLARQVLGEFRQSFSEWLSLTEQLGGSIAECAPAYAVAKLAREKPL